MAVAPDSSRRKALSFVDIVGPLTLRHEGWVKSALDKLALLGRNARANPSARRHEDRVAKRVSRIAFGTLAHRGNYNNNVPIGIVGRRKCLTRIGVPYFLELCGRLWS
jgi:hypothetical protein